MQTEPLTVADLSEPELWRIARYVADYIDEEQTRGKRIDKHTIFWALDALIGGADDTYDEFGVNTRSSFNTPAREANA